MKRAPTLQPLRRPAQPDIDVLIENLPGNVYRRVRRPDASYYFEYLSSGLFRQFGIDHERLLIEDRLRFDWILPDDRARMLSDLEISAATLRLLDHRIRIVGQEGKVYWARGIGRPSRRPDGSTVWDGLVIDVTREVEAEAALRLAKAEADEAHSLASGVVAGAASDLAPVIADLDRLLTDATSSAMDPALRRSLKACQARVKAALHRLPLGAPPAETPVSRATLTRRQEDVLRLLGAGLSNKAIAQQLGITPGTVKLHVSTVLRAAGARSRRELAG